MLELLVVRDAVCGLLASVYQAVFADLGQRGFLISNGITKRSKVECFRVVSISLKLLWLCMIKSSGHAILGYLQTFQCVHRLDYVLRQLVRLALLPKDAETWARWTLLDLQVLGQDDAVLVLLELQLGFLVQGRDLEALGAAVLPLVHHQLGAACVPSISAAVHIWYQRLLLLHDGAHGALLAKG